MAKRNGMTAAQKHVAAHKQRRLARDERREAVTGGGSGEVQSLPRVHECGYMGTGSFMFADKAGEIYIANVDNGTISRPRVV